MKQLIYSHVGKKRSKNEDFSGYATNTIKDHLLIVCDGIGGHQRGDVASKLTVEYLIRQFRKINIKMDTKNYIKWLYKHIQIINDTIFSISEMNDKYKGMGTTISLVLYTNNRYILLNIGDSRIYVETPSEVIQISEDHTFLNEVLKLKNAHYDDYKDHPHRHVITKSIGINEKIDPSVRIIDEDGVLSVLLTTDGLTDLVNNIEIQKIMKMQNFAYSVKIKTFFKIALERGGHDNITVGILYPKENNE